MDEKLKSILSRLESQCARREYCEKDISDKLKRLEVSDGADGILKSLRENGFVSNSRFASAFAREKSSITGWGPVKIRYALSAKGISREDIDEALLSIDGQKASEKLSRLLEVKARTLEGDPDIKLKLIRFALSRGFEYEEVRQAICGLPGR